MIITRRCVITSLILCMLFLASSLEASPHYAIYLQSDSTTTPSRVIHIDSGLSIRNHQKDHYQPMMEWDESQYAEFAYWEETDKGSIVDFMNFRVAFPPDFVKNDPNKKYPTIVMFHGTGGSGRKDDSGFEYTPSDAYYDSNSKQLTNPGKSHLEAVNRPASDPRAFPGIVISPQASYNGAWNNKNVSMVTQFLMWMIREYNVDQDRIVIHGLSNGAKGVWKLASLRPDLFAAALSMSGVGTDLDSMVEVLAMTPMWMFQGDQDTNPSADYSRRWYDALVESGGTPRYSLYENTGHNTWSKAYAEPDFFSWIRAQNIKNIQVMGGDPREDPCEDPVESAPKLGFSAGFLAYQWTRNGQEIAGATDRFITAQEAGIYQVKFKRVSDSTWDESFAMDIFYEESHIPNVKTSLTAEGSTTLPYYGEDRSLKLIASPGFARYEWYKDDVLLENFDGEALVLNNEAGNLFHLEDTGTYTVKVADHCGRTGLLSEPVRVDFDSALLLSAKQRTLAAPLVYPNPFTENVTIEFPDNSVIGKQLIIYDSSGKLIMQKRVSDRKLVLALSGYRPGVYVMAVGEMRIRIIRGR